MGRSTKDTETANSKGGIMRKFALSLVTAACCAVVAGCAHPLAEGQKMRASLTSYPPGSNGFKQIDDKDVGRSVCLRKTKHIRELASPDALMTSNTVFVTRDNLSGSNPCLPAANPPKNYLETGDWVLVTKNANKDPQLQIIGIDGVERFPTPLVLQKVQDNGRYTLMATDTARGLDFYLMLADDKLGNPSKPNVKIIEKFYYVEVFPIDNNNSPACKAERPDDPNNVAYWTGTDCVSPPGPIQLGSGSGGHNYP